MEFITPGEKIRTLRHKLGINQVELESEHLTRNFISMVENGKRGLGRESSRHLANKFNQLSMEINMPLNLSDDYFYKSPEEDAREYCNVMLENISSIEQIEQIEQIANKFNLYDSKAMAHIKMGDIYFEKNSFNKAFTYYVMALDNFKLQGDPSKDGMLFNKLGICSVRLMNYESSLDYFRKSMCYSLKDGNIKLKNILLYNEAISLKKLKRYEESIQVINEHLKCLDKNTQIKQIVNSMVLLANCKRDMGMWENALSILHELLEYEKINRNSLSLIYNNIGLTYFQMGDFDKSIKAFDLSINNSDNDSVQFYSRIDKAKVLQQLDMKDKALENCLTGFYGAKYYKDPEYMYKGCIILGELLADVNRIDEAINSYLDLIELYKSNKLNKSQIKNLYLSLALLLSKANMSDLASKYILNAIEIE
jgi:tetratricopeptide (TPR) repeat protein